MDMSNGCSNIVFNASIQYDECSQRGIQQFNGYFVKFLNLRIDAVICPFAKGMKREMISMSIHDSMTGEQFWVDGVKRRKNLIKEIIHICQIAFDKTVLPFC